MLTEARHVVARDHGLPVTLDLQRFASLVAQGPPAAANGNAVSPLPPSGDASLAGLVGAGVLANLVTASLTGLFGAVGLGSVAGFLSGTTGLQNDLTRISTQIAGISDQIHEVQQQLFTMHAQIDQLMAEVNQDALRTEAQTEVEDCQNQRKSLGEYRIKLTDALDVLYELSQDPKPPPTGLREAGLIEKRKAMPGKLASIASGLQDYQAELVTAYVTCQSALFLVSLPIIGRNMHIRSRQFFVKHPLWRLWRPTSQRRPA